MLGFSINSFSLPIYYGYSQGEMGSNGADGIAKIGAETSETTIEIKIKTLDSQTYTLRVDKQMPVPALKEQIALVTGVLSEQQRLICRGKVLKDDQLLSAYRTPSNSLSAFFFTKIEIEI
ncbi:Ubiquitin-like domain, partial [Dillenia turbinata]